MGFLAFVAQFIYCATVHTLSLHHSPSLLSQLLSLMAAEDGAACHNQQPTFNLTNQCRDSISVDGVVVVFIGVVYQCITDSLYGGIILLNIEQLNEVETDLVERYDVPLTKQSHPRCYE